MGYAQCYDANQIERRVEVNRRRAQGRSCPGVYILVFDPVERRLYGTQTFSRAAFALVQKDPAPLVLHAMGKDAKAIKFMRG